MRDEALASSRVGRWRERRSRRVRVAMVAAAAVLVGVVLVVAGLVAVRGMPAAGFMSSGRPAATPSDAVTAGASSGAGASAAAGHVEVPDLTGVSLAQAEILLRAANLVPHMSVSTTLAPSAGQDVASQVPAAGAVVSARAGVWLSVPPAAKPGPSKAIATRKKQLVVVIDPGHQSRADTAVEPVGPGSPTKQPKVTAGSTGVVTGVPEYELDLQIATNLKDRLEAAGVRVVMTRSTNDVDVSNIQRAQMANDAKADLFIRIHADSNIDLSASGVSTLYPASNQWTKSFSAASQRAAETVQQAVVASTGSRNNGAAARDDVAGFNWAKVPCILVNAGNPANSVEDRLLASAHYQDRLAQGMTDGILKCLDGGR